MSHVGVPRGTVRKRRMLALLTAGVLTVPVLAGCSSDDDGPVAALPQDISPADRRQVADGSTVTWAVDTMPATLNAFQADADSATTRVTGALLPTLFPLDASGQPKLNPDYLESAKVIETEPRQVVLYKLHQQAVWSDGREIGAPDFVAQWRALSGKDSAFWTARNAGYDRIEKIERGHDDLQVRVTFSKPYADWRALFSPLYPKEVTGSPDAFNDGARSALKNTAGPFKLSRVDKDAKTVTVVRDPRWWGDEAKLDRIVFRAVKPQDRAEALAEGAVDVADIDAPDAGRITLAARDGGKNGGLPLTHGPGSELTPAAALRSWALAHGSDEEAAEDAKAAREQTRLAAERYATEQEGLRAYTVRKSLEPSYTQLAINGESGPLSDERVRRAVARALDRQELADSVLKPLGLPSRPLGSHLAVSGQPAYRDGSGALGDQDADEALALLADAGWKPGGARKPAATEAGSEAEKKKGSGDADQDAKDAENPAEAEDDASEKPAEAAGDEDADAGDDGLYIVGDDNKAGDDKPGGLKVVDDEDAHPALVSAQDRRPGGAPGAYAPAGTAAPAAPASVRGPLGKDGKPLTLRFVLPSGPGSQTLRSVGERIASMLDSLGIRTEISKVSDESYFKDHIASGEYDLALYSWPATAYPATDGRPIYAKPVPASDGSLLVEQNYTRVGTDHIDQLFDQAAAELDEGAARDLMRQADARIWAAAGSIPLYQRPQLVAVDKKLVNVGAFGLAGPRYQDIGFRGSGAAGAPARPAKPAGEGAGDQEREIAR
ncbi:ABC transporter family substrate-binding protein [uncultured Streptomyces sp.]|uniref:ABC transporter family substrate-binding protein n=1 Tax=uncultured Streptomyces sp. TaxID=174707 RepID=UPI002630C8B5|nr:ABC transporter family substrate-binding protein [uncultured Streptomyces sp.]